MRKVLLICISFYYGSVSADTVVRHAIGAMPETVERVSGMKESRSHEETTGANIKRAQFTSAIQDREPVDNLVQVDKHVGRVYFFSEITGLAGQAVIHRWEHNGRILHEQRFDVTSRRFRAYSTKALPASASGEWKVSVLDSNGILLGFNTFIYGDTSATAQAQ
ncbi:MAG: DUF2914 domain-containing protein [Gammaproteobacteria bacterium]|nr:DUF2914 domain-containing protein [Gammaproteobacteria bacterium]